jgi:ABC-type multidrug transport system fused ATPase/permease subunit
MFIAVVIISVVSGILFVVLAVSLIGFIVNSVQKNDAAKRKAFRIFIPSLVSWVLLTALNVVFIVRLVYINRNEILIKAVQVPAEMAGQGLALTFLSFEKNWDQNRLRQLEKLIISPSSMSYEIHNGRRVYDIELIFDNTSPTDVKLYLDDLIGNHYLVLTDQDDFVYLLTISDRLTSSVRTEESVAETSGDVTTTITKSSTEYANTIIPFGKSRFRFTASVPEDTDITRARFVNSIIPLK